MVCKDFDDSTRICCVSAGSRKTHLDTRKNPSLDDDPHELPSGGAVGDGEVEAKNRQRRECKHTMRTWIHRQSGEVVVNWLLLLEYLR